MRWLNRLARPFPTAVDYDSAIKFNIFAFATTKLGAFLWEAYCLAREGERPIPDQVLIYLDKCAASVSAGGTPNEIVARFGLRHVRGGAGVSKRLAAAILQVAILRELLIEYSRVEAGVVGSKVEARRIVANRFRTTEGRVHQLELKSRL